MSFEAVRDAQRLRVLRRAAIRRAVVHESRDERLGAPDDPVPVVRPLQARRATVGAGASHDIFACLANYMRLDNDAASPLCWLAGIAWRGTMTSVRQSEGRETLLKSHVESQCVVLENF
ncbi:hypothetical protein DL769_006100 [Monosporascus sp. CRB-8-3]|nr:hypothetical protein DL769_006100 [Monosporascus sp. CRB-8-3]